VKNIKALTLLFFAVLAGLAAAFYAARWLGQRGSLAATRVVVAAVDIELGSRVNPQMLALADWPSDSVPPGAFRDPKELQDRVVKAGVLRGEAIVERKLSPAGTQGGLSAVIAEGKRAMTVRVNDVVGVAGFALPGNFVDVMVNAQRDGGRGATANSVSMTVLEHVLVLAVAQEAGRDDTKPKVVSAVTLELTPEDAEKLDLARSVGTLSLVLRNQLDKRNVATTGITREQLLGLTHAADVRPEPAFKFTATKPAVRRVASVETTCVDVIRGVSRQLECF
jgi:pilus assembly protein CpaB